MKASPQRHRYSGQPAHLPASLTSRSSSQGSGNLHEAFYNLNSAKFEPKRYTHSLLMDQPLASLLQQTNRLAQETRQLDGEMKTLVYENYSKFISATETIGRMKTDVDDMDAEMTKLQVKVNALSAQSSLIHEAFQAGSAKVKHLGTMHQHLYKLQVLFDLPDQLQQCLRNQQWAAAVQSYLDTLPLFDHYRTLAVFAQVEADCRAIMDEVTAALWRIVEPAGSTPSSPEQLPADLLPQLNGTGTALGPPSSDIAPWAAARHHVDRIHQVASAVDLLIRLDAQDVHRLWEPVLVLCFQELSGLFRCLVDDLERHRATDWSFLAPKLFSDPPVDFDAQHSNIMTTPIVTHTLRHRQLFTAPLRAAFNQSGQGDSESDSSVASSASASPVLSDDTRLPDSERSISDIVLEKLARMARLNHVFMELLAEIIDTFTRCFLEPRNRLVSGQTSPTARSMFDSEQQEALLLQLSRKVNIASDEYTTFVNRLLTIPVATVTRNPSTVGDGGPGSRNEPRAPTVSYNLPHVRIQALVIPALFHNRLLHIIDRDVQRFESLRLFAHLDTTFHRLIEQCLHNWVEAVFAQPTRDFSTLLVATLATPLPSASDPDSNIWAQLAYRNPRVRPPLKRPTTMGLPFSISNGTADSGPSRGAHGITTGTGNFLEGGDAPWNAAGLSMDSRLASLLSHTMAGSLNQAEGQGGNDGPLQAPLTGQHLVDLMVGLGRWLIQKLESEACPAFRALLQMDLNFPSHPEGRPALLHQLEAGLGRFMESLPATLIAVCATPELPLNYPAVLLSLGKLCQEFEQTTISQIYQVFSFALLPQTDLDAPPTGLNIIHFPNTAEADAANAAMASTSTSIPPGLTRPRFVYDPKRVSLVWNHGTQKIVNQYVSVVVRVLMGQVRRELNSSGSEDSSPSASTPRISSIWIQMIGGWLPIILQDIQAVFGPVRRGSRTGRQISQDAETAKTQGQRSLVSSALAARSLNRTKCLTLAESQALAVDPTSTAAGGNGSGSGNVGTPAGAGPPGSGSSLSRIPSLTLNPVQRSYSTDSSRHDSITSNTAQRTRLPSLTTYTHFKLAGRSYSSRGGGSGVAAISPGGFGPDYPPLPFSPGPVERRQSPVVGGGDTLPSPGDGTAATGGGGGLPPAQTTTPSLSSRTFSNLDPFHRHLISHIDRLFSDRLEVFGDVSLDSLGITLAIYRAVIKEMIELSRLRTFVGVGYGSKPGGLPQIQLDAGFLRHVWHPYIDKDWVLASLMDEWVSSVATRSVEVVDVDETVLRDVIHTTLLALDSNAQRASPTGS
ncbi:hypothetical protein H4R33_005314 [Dimargaris cristalligena]|nr:hypothetical protein H4R33_005314 [Dimargaris cristalligena]